MLCLQDMCVGAVSTSLDKNAQYLQFLPNQLKSKLLKVACARADFTSDILLALLHSGIEELNLDRCPLADKLVVAVGKCPRLQALDFNSCNKRNVCYFNGLTSPALVNLFPNLQNLVVLHVRKCPPVTDDVICSIAINCPHLSILDVGGCTAITDIGITKLTENLHLLSTLNISDSQVTEMGILTLTQGFCGKSLIELCIDRCKGVTNSAVAAIAKHCSKLKYFYFHECTVTDESWRSLETLVINTKVQQLSWTIY